MVGFGGAFTECAAYNYHALNASTRGEVVERYFGDSGLRYRFGRVPMNSPDFAISSYNYANVSDDFSLAHFDTNVTRDKQFIIPLIRDALALIVASGGKSRDLKLFFSPWSPPGWMKTSGALYDMIGSFDPCLKNDTASGSYRAAWAQYFVQFYAAYQRAGITLWGLTLQNEPLTNTKFTYEGCMWTGGEQRDWLRDYLGPAIRAAAPELQIMVYDHNKLKLAEYLEPIVADPAAWRYCDAVALHWYDYMSNNSLGLAELAQARAVAPPGTIFLNTEASYIKTVTHTHAVAELYLLDILADINFGVSGWVDWNLLTDLEGMPNHVPRHDIGAPILVNTTSQPPAIVVQPSYWYLGHITRFVGEGAVRISAGGRGVASSAEDHEGVFHYIYSELEGQGGDGGAGAAAVPLVASSFLAADGVTVVVVVLNAGPAAVGFTLLDVSPDGAVVRAVNTTIPARAAQTYTYAVV